MAAILSTWMIRTLAGNGELGCTGDGGPPTQARLNEPKGLTVDCHGNVYVADSENHIVRKVDRATGILSTVAGRRITQPRLPSSMVETASQRWVPISTSLRRLLWIGKGISISLIP
ncbi:MAG: hypothetical protein HZC50_12230 [Nitrospirae bacterium]|nr:hypothetical protein [Nitrospirota bacterium]